MKTMLKNAIVGAFILSIAFLMLVACDFREYACVHKWSDWEIIDQGDCKTPGKIQRVCANCGSIDKETIAKKNHTEGEWVVDKKATCAENGEKHIECAICGASMRTEKIPYIGRHSQSDWIIDKAATCTEEGKKHTKCTLCGVTTLEETIPTLDHTESGWIVDKEATCTEEGLRHTECTVCGVAVKSEVINPAHKFEDYNCIHCGLTSEECFYFTYLKETDSYSISTKKHKDLLCKIVLPSTYGGKPVTSISNKAFYDCNNLIEIVIPNSVTYIGSYAFSGCSSLTEIVIPDSITSIGEHAFGDCFSLTDVYYTKSKEDWAKISMGYDNFDLENVTIHYNYVPKE